MAASPVFAVGILTEMDRSSVKIADHLKRFLAAGGSAEELIRQLNVASSKGGLSHLFHAFGDQKARPIIEAIPDYGGVAVPVLLGAVREGDLGLVDFYIERNADPDQSSDWGAPLLEAAHYLEVEVAHELVERLLKAGADPNIAHCSNGCTPLMYAAAAGFHEVVQLLLDAGADVRRTCALGETALHKVMRPTAVAGGRNEDGDAVAVARLLVAHGADVRARSFARYTPLHALANYGSSEAPQLLQVLLDAGVNLEARLRDGMTPLLVAAQSNSTHAVTALVAAGADAAATSWGGTAVSRLGDAETRRLVKSLQMARRVEQAMGDGDLEGVAAPGAGASLTL